MRTSKTQSENCSLWCEAARGSCTFGPDRAGAILPAQVEHRNARAGCAMSQSWHRYRGDIMSQGEGSSLHRPSLSSLHFQGRESTDNSFCLQDAQSEALHSVPVGSRRFFCQDALLLSRQLSGHWASPVCRLSRRNILASCDSRSPLTHQLLFSSFPPPPSSSSFVAPSSHHRPPACLATAPRLSPPLFAASCRRLQCLWLLRLLPRWSS